MHNPAALPTPGLDQDLLLKAQQISSNSAAVTVSRALSAFGEHAIGWIALGLVGAAVDSRRQEMWLRGVAAVVLAHGSAVALKRAVRRRRPAGAGVNVLLKTPSDLSFPVLTLRQRRRPRSPSVR